MAPCGQSIVVMVLPASGHSLESGGAWQAPSPPGPEPRTPAPIAERAEPGQQPGRARGAGVRRHAAGAAGALLLLRGDGRDDGTAVELGAHAARIRRELEHVTLGIAAGGAAPGADGGRIVAGGVEGAAIVVEHQRTGNARVREAEQVPLLVF